MADTPKDDEPGGGWWARLGAALPVALAAIATTFAGMSSGEMARAMFWRSAAAQDQAKAASQWTLAGFKRDRALVCQATAATLRGDAPAAAEARPEGVAAVELPPVDERIAAALAVARDREPEDAQLRAAAAVPLPVIADAIREAEVAVDRFDREREPVAPGAAGRAGQAARFEAEARRYLAEARLNQGVSLLYEVRVRRTTAESERHRRRSENFFYAMLVGQVGATGGSLALARKRRSPLWLFAGLTGLAAVVFGGYVYLTL
jgi:hypothetical protein